MYETPGPMGRQMSPLGQSSKAQTEQMFSGLCLKADARPFTSTRAQRKAARSMGRGTIASGLGWTSTQWRMIMNSARIAAVAALTVAMAAPALAQATPRSASTQHRLQQERMHRPARYHSAYRYEY